MGKVRVKTIGIEEEEKEQKQKAKQRADAKRAEKEAQKADEPKEEEKTEVEPTEKKAETKKVKKEKFKKKKVRGASYLAIAKMIDKNKKLTVAEGLKLLLSTKTAKFDETVELHINTVEKGVSGRVALPHGTGKETRVEIADVTADPKHVEELLKKITSGQIDFDVLIATPDTMPKLASAARFLGPKGLMPNPKNGTVSAKPKEALKQFEGGQISYKTEPKFPIIHLTVGKVSFGEQKLSENIKELLTAIKSKNIKSATLKCTMSPGIKLSV